MSPYFAVLRFRRIVTYANPSPANTATIIQYMPTSSGYGEAVASVMPWPIGDFWPEIDDGTGAHLPPSQLRFQICRYSSRRTKTAATETITTETSMAVKGTVIQPLFRSLAASVITIDAAPL